MTHFRFQDPIWFVLLIPLFIGVLLAVRRQGKSAVLYSSLQVLKTLPPTLALGIKKLLPWVRFLGLALVVLALARPQQGKEEFRIRTEGVAMEMVLDWSTSMVGADFEVDGERVTRLEAVKKVFHDFVAGADGLPGRPDDLIGLVVFGGYPISKCPLTLDHGALLQILDSVTIPEPRIERGRLVIDRLLPEEAATAIGDSVALGVERLKEIEAKSKVLIFLSDGQNTAGVIDPVEAAEAAKTFGVKIYAIGVGTDAARVPIRYRDEYGRTAYEAINTGQGWQLDEKLLKMLAEKTGGRYWHARNTEALKEVYAEIDQLEKTETKGRLYTEYKEFYQYALFPGLALILLELLLSATRFRSLP